MFSNPILLIDLDSELRPVFYSKMAIKKKKKVNFCINPHRNHLLFLFMFNMLTCTGPDREVSAYPVGDPRARITPGTLCVSDVCSAELLRLGYTFAFIPTTFLLRCSRAEAGFKTEMPLIMTINMQCMH